MRRILQASLVTCAFVTGALASSSLPVCAQMDQMGDVDATISFDSFQDQLAPYGYWLYSDRWGVVWQPSQVPYDFRPYYTDGHWVYTDDFGWFWQSDYPWGDIPFHFGRWVNDPEDGWLWIPGYIWSPGWVAWRTNGAFVGWMPLPPDEAFLEGRGDIGIGVRFGGFDIGALYSRWYGPAWNERRFAENWVFVPTGYVAAPDFRRVVITDPVRVVNIVRQTRNVTNFTVVNNIVVNRSIDVRVVERAAGHQIPPVRAATVIRRPNLVTRVDVGQRVQMRMRDIVPRGRGMANSAPPPPPRVVARLSTNVAPRNGRAPVHLFTRATVAAPEAQARFRGPPVRGPAAGAGGEMTGPGATAMRPGQENSPAGNGERMRPERTNGPSGPGGSMQGEQPTTPSGPQGERMRPEQPNGPSGPGGMQNQQQNPPAGPQGGRTRPERPNGPTGPGAGVQGEQPNPPTGPEGGRTRPEQPNSPSGPGGSMQSEQPNPGPEGGRRPPEQPNGPSGPRGSMQGEQPNGPPPPGGGRVRPEQRNDAAGPNAQRAQPQQPNGMNGPNGGANPQNNPPNREQQKKKPQNPPQNPPQ